MENILPILPKVFYLIDREVFECRVTSKKPSYLSYLSYPSFFVHISSKKVVYNSAILYTSPDPCTKKYFYKFRRFLGKKAKKVRCSLQCYPNPNPLIHRDKLTV